MSEVNHPGNEQESVRANEIMEKIHEERMKFLLEEEKKRRWRLLFFLCGVLVSIIGLCFTLIPIVKSSDERLVDKEAIKTTLSQVIKGGADLDLVKHVYSVRTLKRVPLKYDPSLYYLSETPLSIILNDLRVDYMMAQGVDSDTLYYSRLKAVIQENLYHNPFDNLEDTQARYFESLRYKIGEEYELVQDDVQQIATELFNKNQLVTKYLNKSNTSFRISIIALIVTCLLSLFQIIQNWRATGRIKDLEYYIAHSDKKAQQSQS